MRRRGKPKGGRFTTLAVLILAELRHTGPKTAFALRPLFPDRTLEELGVACKELVDEGSAGFDDSHYYAVETEHATTLVMK